MITKEQFIKKVSKLFPEYDLSKINWVSYTDPIVVYCNKHGEFEILPSKLYQQRGRCKKCRIEIISKKNTANAEQRLAKARKTCKEKYGVENPYQAKEIKDKIRNNQIAKYGGLGAGSKIIADKIAKTKEKKYGNSHFTNREKCKETVLNKYGVENVYASPEIIQKKKQSYLLHYGVDNPFKSKEIREKSYQTMLAKYGYKNYGQSEQSKNYLRSDEFKKTRRETLHKNNTYGKSKSEDRCYDKLKLVFPDTIRQYSSNVYPFACDFYIPSLDLYIECNFFWTHGGHWFDSNNEDDINKLDKWKYKNTKFFNTAINVWTISDPKKHETAIKNGLNYLVFWSENEFITWFNTIHN